MELCRQPAHFAVDSGRGRVLWTNLKYPAFGSPILNLNNDGPNSDTSVWNFTPQFGVGMHYFLKPGRSIDFSANAVHISSASLGGQESGRECERSVRGGLHLLEVARLRRRNC